MGLVYQWGEVGSRFLREPESTHGLVEGVHDDCPRSGEQAEEGGARG